MKYFRIAIRFESTCITVVRRREQGGPTLCMGPCSMCFDEEDGGLGRGCEGYVQCLAVGGKWTIGQGWLWSEIESEVGL